MEEGRPPKQQRTDHLPSDRIALILCGLPGAGKSTFASKLIAISSRQWVRINQDTIDRGRRGTREQCLQATRTNLRAGLHVIIDRTNLDAEQRKVFVDVAKECGLSPAHILCVYFDFPPKVCGARAAGRQGHEGGLQGQRSYATVGSMAKILQNNGPPHHLKEGFGAVITCKSDEDADKALEKLIDYAEKGCSDPHVLEITSSRPIKKTIINLNSAGAKNAFEIMMASSASQGLSQVRVEHQEGDLTARSSFKTRSRHDFRSSPFVSAFDRYIKEASESIRSESKLDASAILHRDDLCVLVMDKYPKARHHALVIARNEDLQGPLDLRFKDVGLVQHMKKVGLGWAVQQEGSNTWAIGFHAVPSIRRLHLHVISKDYDSPCLKTKKHWLSFTSPDFFLDVDRVLEQMEKAGASGNESEYVLHYSEAVKLQLLKGPLRCHSCGLEAGGMEQLKIHIRRCGGGDCTGGGW